MCSDIQKSPTKINGVSENSQLGVTRTFQSLKELLDAVTGKGTPNVQIPEDSGLVEVLPFPFLALVGQKEMKLALLLALINPAIGGVLLIGPRGTGKSTAVRSLVDLLPDVKRSLCYYGCLPEDVESGGIDAVCPECATKYAEGKPLAKFDRVRLVELPLNVTMESVIGGLDERAAIQDRIRVRKGLLAQADRNILYVDEVNLLQDEVVDALLDASSQGKYTVRRGSLSATYHSRFILVGSMNPEEGYLRPQIMDRFGLRVIVRGLEDLDERFEAYQRVKNYLVNPRRVREEYALETSRAQSEIQSARDSLLDIDLPDNVASIGLQLIQRMKLDSLRAEITLFESARAHAAAEGRSFITMDDLRIVAPMALRFRRSQFIKEFYQLQNEEEKELFTILDDLMPEGEKTKKPI